MLSDLSMIMQIISFLVLIYAIYTKQVDVLRHGKLASIAFYFALPSIIYMLYSRSRGFELPDYNSILGLHIILGVFTIFFSIIFITNQWKWKGKKYMDLGIILWSGTFLLGIIIYMLISGFLAF
ncbi:MAG: hypothetical protein ACPK85_06095 [Methanosarcina sp.]